MLFKLRPELYKSLHPDAQYMVGGYPRIFAEVLFKKVEKLGDNYHYCRVVIPDEFLTKYPTAKPVGLTRIMNKDLIPNK